LSAFEDDEIRAEAGRVVEAARRGLLAFGYEADLPLLQRMLETRRTPAHALRERFMLTGSLFSRQQFATIP
jgi:hypothetical protein